MPSTIRFCQPQLYQPVLKQRRFANTAGLFVEPRGELRMNRNCDGLTGFSRRYLDDSALQINGAPPQIGNVTQTQSGVIPAEDRPRPIFARRGLDQF